MNGVGCFWKSSGYWSAMLVSTPEELRGRLFRQLTFTICSFKEA
jgi:hypothetical protein